MDLLARRDLFEAGPVPDTVFLELALEEGQRELRSVQRKRELPQQVRQRPDVVLMPVGQDHRFHPVLVVPEVLEVGEDQVDPGHLHLREGQTGVDHQDAALQLERGHVPADLPDTAEKDQSGVARRWGEAGHGLVLS